MLRIPTDPRRVDLWVIDTNRPSLSSELCHLSKEERAQAWKLNSRARQSQYINSRVATRDILSHYLGIPPREVNIVADGKGKPRIESATPTSLSFSLSHTVHVSLVAVSSAMLLGCDIERVRSIDDALLVSERFFTAQEFHDLSICPPEQRSRRFLEYWTAKEAVLKATGLGLPGGLSAIEFRPTPKGRLCLHSCRLEEFKVADWTVESLEWTDGLIAAVACSQRVGCIQRREYERGWPSMN